MEAATKNKQKVKWTVEEDQKLAETVAIHGAKNWTFIASETGLNRCRKSCRLRWMNYLRPNIKRGKMSDQEEDLIIRMHKLIGNRWSLIAGRLPGRTDNDIKNYWRTRLGKKECQNDKQSSIGVNFTSPNSTVDEKPSITYDDQKVKQEVMIDQENYHKANTNMDVDSFFDFIEFEECAAYMA